MAKLIPSSSSSSSFAAAAHVTFLMAVLLFVSLFEPSSAQLEWSQYQGLLRLHQLLNYSINTASTTASGSDLCNIVDNEPTTTSFTIACYEYNLTQLHINGPFPLPIEFSPQTFFSAMTAFPALKVLSLVSLGLQGPLPAALANLTSLEILNVSSNGFTGEIPLAISSLNGLQTLILDSNQFTGQVPGWLGSLPAMTVLSLRNNFLTGPLPSSFTYMRNLRVLALSENNLSGEIPDLHQLLNLQVIDFQGNSFGPKFPSLPTRLVTLVLRNNKLGLGLPTGLSSYYQLQKLDISTNGFVGPFPSSVLSLPSIQYLDISGNKFTGLLLSNMSCNPGLAFVNLSSNLLTGSLPSCLLAPQDVLYADNCLSSKDHQKQRPPSFCHNEALAVTILPNTIVIFDINHMLTYSHTLANSDEIYPTKTVASTTSHMYLTVTAHPSMYSFDM